MRLARILGGLGRLLLWLGVLVLLFVAYQLWGTSLQTAQSQNDAERAFRQAEQRLDDPTVGAPDRGDSPTAATDDATISSIPAPASDGELLGRIEMPAIGADWYFYEGVGLDVLQGGPGHYTGTSLPGQPGNASIAGHRTTYGAPFNRIDELASGDEVVITYPSGATFTYDYRSTEIVRPDQVEVLQDNDFDGDGEVDDMLTLTACHPKYSARERIIVRARLREAPIPRPPGQQRRPPTSFDDAVGVSGDPVSNVPAVLWGIATGMIWLAAIVVGRAWRKWPTYALGLPFFLAALYLFFENFYALLPPGF